MNQKQNNKPKKNGKVVRTENFPFLVLNGFDKTGDVVWIDYGHYFKVYLKSEYHKL
jgi:hypothetical protein